MSIILRNQLTDTDKYKVTDVALTGVSFDAARNETTLTIPSTDTRHDATNIGDYIIPMRGGNPVTQTEAFYSYDILHPEKSLQVINKITGTSERKLVLRGDQRNKFPGAGGYASPDAFNKEINVSKIVRNRKYRIVDTGETTWSAFGNLHNRDTESTKDSILATVGTTFVAKSSGSSTQTDADSPIFTAGAYFGGLGGTNLPYYIESTALTAGRQTTEVAGRYDKVTPYLYQREDSSIVIQKIGATDNSGVGRWTIWNQDTGQIYFEEKDSTLGTNTRFDSPSLDDTTNRPGLGDIPPQARDDGFGNANSPKVEWNDRTISVPIGKQYTGDNSDEAGKVIEVAHVSSMIGINRPLSNTDIDSNFVSIENDKLAADGSQPVEGNLIINGALNASSVNVTNQILMTGVTPFSANTGLALGTKDLEVNNIRLSGSINDDALFRQYGIVGFPHSFIADFNPKYSAIEPTTILYFNNVNDVITDDNIQALGNGKRGEVRRVNSEYNYIQVSESNATDKFLPGDTIVNKEGLGPILKVLNPEDYLKVGQNLRIFGINQRDDALANYVTQGSTYSVTTPVTPSAPTATGRFTTGGSRSYSYKLAQFDIRTGKISGLSSNASVVNAPQLLDFDKNNYVQLTGISRVSKYHLVLVYRKANDEATHHLIDILGNEEFDDGLNNLTHNDYGAFNKPQWSVLNNEVYHYKAESGLVYVPINESERIQPTGFLGGSKTTIPHVGDQNKYSRGFLDTKVATGMLNPKLDTNLSPAFFRITETEMCKGPSNGYSNLTEATNDSPNIAMSWTDYTGTTQYWNSPLDSYGQTAEVRGVFSAPYGKKNELEIFIDSGRIVDSPTSGIVGGIQKLIQDKIADGTRTARLPGGVYYSKLLTLPSDFKFEGASDRNTIVKSLPWLDDSINSKTVYGGNVSKLYGNLATGTFPHNYDGVSYDYQAKIAMEYYPETTTGEIGTTSTVTGGISRFATLGPDQAKLGSSAGIFEGVFAGNKSYARSVLEFDAKNNVEIANIRLDGNVVNQTVVEMDISGKSNFSVSGQKSKNISIKNTTIADTVLGGFYGEEIQEGIIEGSIVKNGGNVLSTNAFASGLYLPGSSKIRLTSNSIENFSAANDLTSNQNSTLVGNIIRDTGSGVLAYATSNFIYEGNLILGPADEYIPVVDTLNSEFDQLNVNLITESGAAAGDFISDTIQFLRDNSPLDLRPNDITKANKIDQVGIALTSTIRTMVGLGTQSYFLPDQTEGKTFNYTFGGIGTAGSRTVATESSNGYVIQPNTELEDGTITLKQGNISFKIPQSKIQELAEVAGFATLTNNYNSLNTRPAGEQLIGLVYDLSGLEYLYMDSAADSEKILWKEIEVDTTANAQTLKFTIDSNYANLFSIGDKIIFTSGAPSEQIGRADNFSTSLVSGTTDANSNVMFQGLPVLSKTILAEDAEITIDISGDTFSTARQNLSNATFSVTNLSTSNKNQCRLGIQNTFSITRGRIVI